MLHQDKVAIVTGGASGIGAAAALTFAREGARVVVADLDAGGGTAIADRINAGGGQALFVETDVGAEAQVANLVERTVERFGGLDIAFNNAGTSGEYCTAVTCRQEAWDSIMRVNVSGLWFCLKHQIPAMIERGGGAIVNTASRASEGAAPNLFAYVTTKHAVLGMTRSAAVDFAADHIRVNAILPGAIDTPMLQTAVDGIGLPMEAWSEPVPLKRVGTAGEAAEVAVWLCSAGASYLTGTSIVVDGGKHITL